MENIFKNIWVVTIGGTIISGVVIWYITYKISKQRERFNDPNLFKNLKNLLEDIQVHFSEKLGLTKLLKNDPVDYVSLSAMLADRIPPTLKEKERKSLKAGAKIQNLNKFLHKRKYRSKTFIITGEPGCGKTYEMIKLFLDYKEDFLYKNGKIIPILILINSVPKGYFKGDMTDYSLQNFLKSYFANNSFDSEVINNLIRNFDINRFLIIIDGLDEILNKEHYRKAIQTFSNWANDYYNYKKSNVQFIFSCRSEDYDFELDPIRKG